MIVDTCGVYNYGSIIIVGKRFWLVVGEKDLDIMEYDITEYAIKFSRKLI